MAERSKRIELKDVKKLENVNDETKALMKKYQMDMELTKSI